MIPATVCRGKDTRLRQTPVVHFFASERCGVVPLPRATPLVRPGKGLWGSSIGLMLGCWWRLFWSRLLRRPRERRRWSSRRSKLNDSLPKNSQIDYHWGA